MTRTLLGTPDPPPPPRQGLVHVTTTTTANVRNLTWTTGASGPWTAQNATYSTGVGGRGSRADARGDQDPGQSWSTPPHD